MDKTLTCDYSPQIIEALGDFSRDLKSIQLIGSDYGTLFLFKATFNDNKYHIICHDDNINKSKKIFEESNEAYNILSGTINRETTLLFFVTSAPDRTKNNVKRYRSYLHYVGHEGKPCKLSSCLFYTQFQLININNAINNDSHSWADKSLYLLAMAHPEKIELNTIPRELRGSHLVISGKGEFATVVRNFLWAQWDPLYNRLFTVCSRGDGDLENISTVLWVNQFVQEPGQKPGFILVAEFQINTIPFPKRIYYERAYELVYDSHRYPISHVLSDVQINIIALWHTNGSFCLCVQRPSWLSKGQFPTYKIFILHQSKTLLCSLDSRLPEENVGQSRLLFHMLNASTVMAMTPYFVHLIQINRSSRISLSTLLPKLLIDLENAMPWTSAPNSSRQKAFIFDKKLNQLFSLEPSLDLVINALDKATSTLTRALIFHYVIANFREIEVHVRLLRTVLKDLCDPEIQLFLHEYLVASIFQQFIRRANTVQSRLIQHTTLNEDIIQTHVFGKDNDSMIVKITVGNSDCRFTMKAPRRFLNDPFIDNLHDQLQQCLRCNWNSSTEKFIPSICSANNSSKYASLPVIATPKPDSGVSLLERLRGSFSSRRSNMKTPSAHPNRLGLTPPSANIEKVLGRLPQFLSNPLYTPDEIKPLWTSFSAFLRSNSALSTLNENSESLTHDYVQCVMFQVRQMLHIIWFITMEGMDSSANLTNPNVTQRDWDCFQILESAIICFKSNAYPVPMQVEDMYARLAFRLLDLRTLVQYLDCGVLHINESLAIEIMELTVEDCCYSESDLMNLKKEILVLFPKRFQVEQLLPRCEVLRDYLYRTNDKYRSLLQSKS